MPDISCGAKQNERLSLQNKNPLFTLFDYDAAAAVDAD
jgi:hypothetical protein